MAPSAGVMNGHLISSLNLYKYTGGHLDAVDCFNRPGRWLADVNDSLVRPHLKLLARFLIDVRAA